MTNQTATATAVDASLAGIDTAPAAAQPIAPAAQPAPPAAPRSTAAASLADDENVNPILRMIAAGIIAPPSTLDQLIDLQEKQRRMGAERAFFAAMSAFRAECPEIAKNKLVSFTTKDRQTGRVNGKTEYRHAELHTIMSAVNPVLGRHGLSVTWSLDDSDRKWPRVSAVLRHRDGHEVRESLGGPLDDSGRKNALQSMKSTISYLERTTVEAVLGIATGTDDDDGRLGAAAGYPPGEVGEPAVEYIDAALFGELLEHVKASGGDPAKWSAYRVGELGAIDPSGESTNGVMVPKIRAADVPVEKQMIEKAAEGRKKRKAGTAEAAGEAS